MSDRVGDGEFVGAPNSEPPDIYIEPVSKPGEPRANLKSKQTDLSLTREKNRHWIAAWIVYAFSGTLIISLMLAISQLFFDGEERRIAEQLYDDITAAGPLSLTTSLLTLVIGYYFASKLS